MVLYLIEVPRQLGGVQRLAQHGVGAGRLEGMHVQQKNVPGYADDEQAIVALCSSLLRSRGARRTLARRTLA
jgi:hypothetical protein